MSRQCCECGSDNCACDTKPAKRPSSHGKQRELLKRIDALKIERKKLDERIETLSTKLMSKCPHSFEALREADSASSSFGTPPFRVCIDCGLAEEGWGCGYRKLGGGCYSGIPTLPRDAARKYVRRYKSQRDMYREDYPERFDKSGNEIEASQA